VDLVGKIQNEIGIRAMAHSHLRRPHRHEIGAILDELWRPVSATCCALRGDPQGGQATFVPTAGGFAYANELVKFVAERTTSAWRVAGYPEGHPQCLNRTRDLEHLKRKVDNGGRFVITQLFFDNADFYRWREQARAMGVQGPIIAGIMPITNVAQIKRFIGMCGAKIPHQLLLKLEQLEHDPEAVYTAGVEYATRQCQDLLFHGVDASTSTREQEQGDRPDLQSAEVQHGRVSGQGHRRTRSRRSLLPVVNRDFGKNARREQLTDFRSSKLACQSSNSVPSNSAVVDQLVAMELCDASGCLVMTDQL
jgi:methylenetetrahydrofolate reductase (NADPH)